MSGAVVSAAGEGADCQGQAPAPLLEGAEIVVAGVSQVGAKAWRLAQLQRYGFAVPALHVVPAWVHDEWLDRSGLRDRLCCAGPADLTDLQAKLTLLPLPPALVTALSGLVSEGGSWAVRSSAPHEDGVSLSFAGQYASCLNVRDLDGLCAAVRQVWASLWNPAAVSYRAHHGAVTDVGMAVLVMPMVSALSSGVAFTQDPVTGEADRLIIHANWGLGESVVQGVSECDEIRASTAPLNAALTDLQVRPGRKTQQVQAAPRGGTHLHPVPATRQCRAVLDARQAGQLAGLVRQAGLSLDFAAPRFDVEWAFDGRAFWLLQARPLTGVRPQIPPGLAGQPVVWSRGNTGDVTPLPLSAVDWSAAQSVAYRVLESSLRAAGVKLDPAAERFRLRGGYLYVNMTLMQWELNRAFGIMPADTAALLGGQRAALTVPSASLLERAGQWRRVLRLAVLTPLRRWQGRRQAVRLIRWSARQATQPLPRTPLGQAQQLERLFTHLNRQDALFFMQGGSGAGVWLLRRLLERLLPGNGEVLALDLLTGGRPSVSARQAHELAGLASLLRADAAARQWTQQAARGPAGRDLPRWHPFRSAFRRYLRRYGHRATYESYARHARWREDPTPLLKHLSYLAAQPPGQAAPATLQPTWARLRDRLPRPLRYLLPVLCLLVGLARQELRDRELGRSAVYSPVEPYRRLLLHIGQEWAKRGFLNNPTDMFDLTLPEIHALLRQERPAAGVKNLVLDRQRLTGIWQHQSVPELYAEGALVERPPEPPAPGAGTHGQRIFTGTGASGGTVTGRACVMNHPGELHDLQAGDILVVPSTDPSWTPALLQAGGVVMESGGLLSHGTIVAREFGLPVVLNVRSIRQYVRTGDRLRVNAAAGTVTVESHRDGL